MAEKGSVAKSMRSLAYGSHFRIEAARLTNKRNGLDDFIEVAFDGDASAYTPGQDTDPLLPDTDADGLGDGVDPIPLQFNFADGDVAPLGAPDGVINVADRLIAARIVLGLLTATTLELAHGDLYPPGSPDGIIGLPDLILLDKQVLQSPGQ